MNKYKMVSENMLVREEDGNRNVTKSGIEVISDKAESFMASGIVVEVGPGTWKGEKLVAPHIKVGDRVWFSKKPNAQYLGSVPFEPTYGDKYFVVRQPDVYAFESLES